MTAPDEWSINETSNQALRQAFMTACSAHKIEPDDDEGKDIATILSHAFHRGVVQPDDLLRLVRNLVTS